VAGTKTFFAIGGRAAENAGGSALGECL